ncbi:MAG: alpha/beta hydrolase [Lactobacillaceae bacterium]|nr:alpha/beta hydrolase [Lactobacillaceae bacterium]
MLKFIRNIIIVLIVVIIVGAGYFFYVAEVRQEKNNRDYTFEQKKVLKPMVESYLSAYKKRGEEVSIKNDGLKLKAEYVPAAKKTNKTIIVIHGFRVNRTSMYPYSDMFLKQGYNVLTVDDRGHGKSEGNFVGYGWLDKGDIEAWIQYLIKENSKVEIVPFGTSMGAATVAMMSGDKLSSNVKAFIEESGYSNTREEIEYQATQQFSFLSAVKKPIVQIVSLYSQLFAGYSYNQADTVAQVKKNTRPMLFMHGGSDTFVPTKMVYKLYDADPNKDKQIWVAPGSEHVQALADYPKLYNQKTSNFLKEYFK